MSPLDASDLEALGNLIDTKVKAAIGDLSKNPDDTTDAGAPADQHPAEAEKTPAENLLERLRLAGADALNTVRAWMAEHGFAAKGDEVDADPLGKSEADAAAETPGSPAGDEVPPAAPFG